MKRGQYAVSVLTISLLLSLNVVADSQQETFEVIEVTAQKRVQSIQEVPISISVISADTLSKLQLNQAHSISAIVPNLNTTRSISGSHNYFIRGIGMDDFNLSTVSAIGLYLDGVAINNPMLANFALFDVARVEVLRGPQNALYGKNTTGGAINFLSEKPQVFLEHIEGYGQLSIGQYNARAYEGAISLPIDEQLTARISGFSRHRDGFVSSTANEGSEYDNVDQYGLRLQGLYQVSDELNLHASVYGGKQDQIAEIKKLLIGDSQTGRIDLARADLSTIATPLVSPINKIESLGGFLKLQWQQENFTLNAISAFEDVSSQRKDDWGSQGAPSGVYQVLTFNSTDTQSYSQEFQLISSEQSKIDWIAGLLISKETGDILQTAYIDPAGPGRPDDNIDDPGIGPLFDRGAWVDVDTLSYSVYGQFTWPITDNWAFTTGWRWTQQELKPTLNSTGQMQTLPDFPPPFGSFGWYSLGNNGFNVLTDYAGFEVAENFSQANGGFPATINIDETFNEWGGKLGLDYYLNKQFLFYGTIAKGFKMGAVNSNPTTAAYEDMLSRVVTPEELLTYELGWKLDFDEYALRVNGAIFHNDWQDYQFYQVFNPGNPAHLFATLVNLPEANSTGAELELQWLPGEQWALKLGLAWLDTEVIDGNIDTTGVPEQHKQNFQNTVVAGNKLTNAPEWSYHLSIGKQVSFEKSDLSVLLNYSYQGEHIHQLAGKQSDVWQHNFSEPSLGLLSLSATIDFGVSRQYQFAVWGTNLTDENYCTERAVIPGMSAETARLCAQGQPKLVGINFRLLFD